MKANIITKTQKYYYRYMEVFSVYEDLGYFVTYKEPSHFFSYKAFYQSLWPEVEFSIVDKPDDSIVLKTENWNPRWTWENDK